VIFGSPNFFWKFPERSFEARRKQRNLSREIFSLGKDLRPTIHGIVPRQEKPQKIKKNPKKGKKNSKGESKRGTRLLARAAALFYFIPSS
jgi:hypothetical protein